MDAATGTEKKSHDFKPFTEVKANDDEVVAADASDTAASSSARTI